MNNRLRTLIKAALSVIRIAAYPGTLVACAAVVLAGDIDLAGPTTWDLEFPEPSSVTSADFNGDGHVDLVGSTAGAVFDWDGAAITVLLGDGTGGFPDNPSIEETESVMSVAAADFDGDERPDLVYLLSPSSLRVALGDGTGTFGNPVTVGTSGGRYVVAGDLNRDGLPDLLTDDNLSFFAGLGNGAFANPISTPLSVDVYDLTVVDMNLDHISDAVISTPQGWVLVYLGDGNGQFTQAGSTGGGLSYTQWTRIAVGDLNGDDLPDVVWVTDWPYEVNLAFGLGDGELTGKQVVDSYGASAYEVVITDLNQDCRNDLAVALMWSGFNVYAGSGDGTFGAPQFWTTGMEPRIGAALDVNHDQGPDLVFGCRNSGDTPFLAVHLNQSQYGPCPSCEGDANDDGTVDPLDAGYVLARLGCAVGAGDVQCDASDQNDDGLVDPLDVGFVLARFGACP